MPAYNAQGTIIRSVQSVLAQCFEAWELCIIADDGVDYTMLLRASGIVDGRIRYLTTGGTACGASYARNVGIENASADILTLLDADDTMHAHKLSICMPHMQYHMLVSCGLTILNEDDSIISEVGTAVPTACYPLSDYKRINYGCDSMILFNRRALPVQYETGFNVLEDLAFIIACAQHMSEFYHVATPLHHYYKRADNLSTCAAEADNFFKVKHQLIELLNSGHYTIEPATVASFIRFLELSLEAEQAYRNAQPSDDIFFEPILYDYLCSADYFAT